MMDSDPPWIFLNLIKDTQRRAPGRSGRLRYVKLANIHLREMDASLPRGLFKN
jgi:hypothetical protein